MSRPSRPSARLPFFALLLGLAAAVACPWTGIARADEPEQDVPQPDHSASEMAFTAEIHPKDMTLVSAEEKERPAAEKAIKDAIDALAKDAKIAMSELTTEVASLRYGEGKTATFVLVDVYAPKPGDFRKNLEEKAKTSGWAFREMASPVRLLVVAGPVEDLEKLVAAQVEIAGQRLAQTGLQRAQNGFPERAESYAKTALVLTPGLAFAHFVIGVAAEPSGQGPHPASAYEKTIAEFRLALDEKAAVPLMPHLVANVKGALGNIVLNAADGKPSEEARDSLKYAVDHASDIPHLNREVLLGWKYNLACAYGRLKELDPAFEHVKGVLEENKKETVRGIDHWRKDPDFNNLHEDPRWAELLTAYPEGAEAPPEDPHHGGGGGDK